MKVYPCNNKAVEYPAKPLPSIKGEDLWDVNNTTEGIYYPNGYGDYRLIVTGTQKNERVVFVYARTTGTIFGANRYSWNTMYCTKLENARLCMEVIDNV